MALANFTLASVAAAMPALADTSPAPGPLRLGFDDLLYSPAEFQVDNGPVPSGNEPFAPPTNQQQRRPNKIRKRAGTAYLPPPNQYTHYPRHDDVPQNPYTGQLHTQIYQQNSRLDIQIENQRVQEVNSQYDNTGQYVHDPTGDYDYEQRRINQEGGQRPLYSPGYSDAPYPPATSPSPTSSRRFEGPTNQNVNNFNFVNAPVTTPAPLPPRQHSNAGTKGGSGSSSGQKPSDRPPGFTKVETGGSGGKTQLHAILDYDDEYYDDDTGSDSGQPAVTPVQGPILLRNGSVPVVPLTSYQTVNNGSFYQIPGKHTTNLKNHLAAKHTNEYQIVTTLNKDIYETNRANETITVGKTEKLMNLCIRLVTIHGRPIAMMEDEAFQQIIIIAASSDNAYKSTNVKAVKTNISQAAHDIRIKISNELKNKMLSLKLDAATCLERKFIGVNIQYIKDAEIVIRNLAVLEINRPQTADFLKSVLHEILTEYKISSNQIYCICSDNGTNMKKMVKLMGGHYESQDDEDYNDEDTEYTANEHLRITETDDFEEFFNAMDLDISTILDTDQTFNIRGMLCAAHTLQLAVKDGIKNDVGTQEVIDEAKRIVGILRKPNNVHRLTEENLRKPVKYCITRWTATYNMLVRLEELKEFCSTVPEIEASETFWVKVTELVTCLRPLFEATIMLQKEQLTIGDFYITWLDCKNNVGACPHDFAKALHMAMEERQIKLMQNDVVLEALYLDSRLNVVLSPEECRKARALLNEVFNNLQSLKVQEPEPDSIPLISDVSQASSSRDLSAIENLLSNTERARGNTRQRRSFDLCLYEVITAPRLHLRQNIIQHWNNKAVVSSEIAEVAKTVLSAPATQVSVERLFSSLKFILHPLRGNISSNLLKDIMVVRANKDLF